MSCREPDALVPVTRTFRSWVPSAATSVYVRLVAPGISLQSPPLLSQRSHWKVRLVAAGLNQPSLVVGGSWPNSANIWSPIVGEVWSPRGSNADLGEDPWTLPGKSAGLRPAADVIVLKRRTMPNVGAGLVAVTSTRVAGRRVRLGTM